MQRPVGPSCGVRTALVVAVIVLLVWVALVALYWPAIDQAIAYEDSPITWLSTSVLVACATLALVLAEQGAGRRWYGVGVLLVAAALDERFMGHELLRDIWLAPVVGKTGALANLPMLSYLLAGAWLTYASWQAFPPGIARALLILALLAGAVAITLDITTVAMGWQVLEEMLELLSELLFLCSLIVVRAYSAQSMNTLVPNLGPES